MNKKDRDLELEISKSVISNLSDENLKKAKNVIDNLLEYKRIKKLYDTYIQGVRTSLENTGNGKIYVRYNLDGAVTGRLSNSGIYVESGNKSFGKFGISFHTLPREQEDFNIRNYVIAPEGHKFVTADVKAMELRILAHVSGDKNMINAFKSGEDLHSFSASMTFGVDIEDVTKEQRQLAKEVSFLTVYGGTAYTLSMRRGITEKKAQGIIDKWMSAYPSVPKYMDWCRDFIEKNSYISTIFNRRRNLPNIRSPFKPVRETAYRQGLNFTIQSPASDVLLCSMLGIENVLKKRGMKSKIVATVHDSIEFISPDDEVDTLCGIIYNQMVNYYYLRNNFNIELKVPIDIDIEVGTSFGNGKRYEIG